MRSFQFALLPFGQGAPVYDPQVTDAQEREMLGRVLQGMGDLTFPRENWKWPLVLKEVQRVAVGRCTSFSPLHLYPFRLFSPITE